MVKPTMIDLIRDEFQRIASREDRQDLVTPVMLACWSFTKVMVLGRSRSQALDFDFLQDVMRKVPTGSGQAIFWRTVDSVKLRESASPAKGECAVIQLQDYMQGRRA